MSITIIINEDMKKNTLLDRGSEEANVNCIVYTLNGLMYAHIFSYLVNKLEIQWVYISPIEKRYTVVN